MKKLRKEYCMLGWNWISKTSCDEENRNLIELYYLNNSISMNHKLKISGVYVWPLLDTPKNGSHVITTTISLLSLIVWNASNFRNQIRNHSNLCSWIQYNQREEQRERKISGNNIERKRKLRGGKKKTGKEKKRKKKPVIGTNSFSLSPSI